MTMTMMMMMKQLLHVTLWWTCPGFNGSAGQEDPGVRTPTHYKDDFDKSDENFLT